MHLFRRKKKERKKDVKSKIPTDIIRLKMLENISDRKKINVNFALNCYELENIGFYFQ